MIYDFSLHRKQKQLKILKAKDKMPVQFVLEIRDDGKNSLHFFGYVFPEQSNRTSH
jgi:hypothetical protein